MLKRIITSIVAVCVLVPVLFLSGTAVLPAAVAIVTVIAVFEMLKCMGIHKKYAVCAPLYVASAAVPFMLRYIENRVTVASICFVAAVLYLIVMFVSIVWSHGKFSFADGMAMYALGIYIIAAMNSIIYVRDFGDGGKYVYLLIFMGAWITDIFAYFTGVFFGKHKLIEDVSPKKTIEGSIGGIFFCALSFIVFGLIVGGFFDRDANLVFLAVSGVIVSVISQVGDLIMSVIKRHYGIKDYGKIFPGHGGMLDRFDSVLAVSLGMCAICMFAGIMGITLL
jgi:phosphatidate cytidylyltransferase